MPKAVYIQFANPELYPPLEHGSRILVSNGWKCFFYGRRHAMTGKIVFPLLDGRRVEALPNWSMRLPTKVEYLLYAIWVAVKVAVHRPDVIYVSDPLATPLGLLFHRLGFKVVYHEHDSPEQGSVPKWMLAARRRLFRSALCSVIPNAKRIEEEDLDMRKLLEVRNYPMKDEVVKLERSDSSAVRIVYIGTLVPSRLPVSFFEALDACGLPIEVELMGYETVHSNGFVQELMERFRSSRTLKINFLGAFARTEMLKRAAQADVGLLLFSQLDDVNEGAMAGASNKVGDYLAAGIPMLCFRSEEFEVLSSQLVGVYFFDEGAQLADTLIGVKADYAEVSARRMLQEQIANGMYYEAEFQQVLKRISRG
mgnify:CR=1 FL=1